MDAIFGSIGLPLSIVLAVAATVAAYVYFGKRGAQIAAAASALLLAVFAIRRDAQQDAKQDRLEEDLKNETRRNERIVEADRAGDAARNVPDSRLRDRDPFQID